MSARSHVLARVIDKLATQVQADAIAVNCHGPAFRSNPDVGIVACLAASTGRPMSCTADVPTAWLLAVATRLAGAALYCEPYGLDDARAAVLFGNCGIGNVAMACPGTWRELPSQFYPGCAGCGTSVAMSVRPGAATFVSVVPSRRQWGLCLTEGEILDARLPAFGGAHAYFKPASGSPRTWFTRQAARGSAHHGALMLGHQATHFRDVAADLGVEILLA
jgi:L-arabinose isomerase